MTTLYRRTILGAAVCGVLATVGVGRIAQHVARRVQAFDALVRYAKPVRAAAAAEAPSGAVHQPLEYLLDESDIVSLHAPLSTHTRGIINARALARMRPGSYLVNTARGALVDEAALADALASGHLAGAGLDAFAHEPLDPASPLLKLPNVVLTPHVAGSTRDAWVYRMTNAWDNVRRVAAGEEPRSRIA